jgi:glycosyltransferase involved in cell wall biosynthesis
VTPPSIACVIPTYRARSTIGEVVKSIPPEVGRIFVVDDACPEESGEALRASCNDPRVVVLKHRENRGVGGATKTGFREAVREGWEVVVKLDSDGQMDPALVSRFAEPILAGRADYVKGNRFFNLEDLRAMPRMRLLGNIALSFVNKVTSGYWNTMDPTNGYVAIQGRVLALLPLDKIADRYFFESDMLFRLNTIGAVVEDLPMPAVYRGEASSLPILRTIFEFPPKFFVRFLKRIGYNYFLRDFNGASFEIVLGLALGLGGVCYGTWKWHLSVTSQVPATAGMVMIAALPVFLGAQLLVSAINHDIGSVPKVPLHPRLPDRPVANGPTR